jgi:membrane-bound lytic murein transglycosylase MltF
MSFFSSKTKCLAWAAIIAVAILGSPGSVAAFERYNRVTTFDTYFSKYTKRFFGPAFDWRYFKAQAVAESRLKAGARSHVGALGLMQIMPHTFKEIRKKNPAIKGTREQPRWNIAAGIYYDRQLWRTWKAERPFQDRLNFTFGAYNAGKMNIIRAQRAAKKSGLDPNRWASIRETLPGVTGKHSRETIEYVDKIETITEVLH